MPHEVEVMVAGNGHGGWLDVRCTRSIEQIANTFEASMTDKWSALGRIPQLDSGVPTVVTADGQPLITGYIDDVEPSYTEKDHSIRIRGRDRAGDLVDCAARWQKQEWRGRNLLQAATDLCRPFGIDVLLDAGVSPGKAFGHIHIQHGETAYEILERLARARGRLFVSDPLGNLIITKPGRGGYAKTPLVLGQNILEANGSQSYKDRFSQYVVQGQHRGSDGFRGKSVSEPSGTELDLEIKRWRPHYVTSESPATTEDCKKRAAWERKHRKARSNRNRFKVASWMDGTRLWTPNTLVMVVDPWLRIEGRQLLVEASFYQESDTQYAELTVAPPDAFDIEVEKEQAPATSSGSTTPAFGSGFAP